MKKGILIAGIVMAFIAIIPQQARATHAMGSSITYKWINDTTFEITYWFYRDCMGILPVDPQRVNLDAVSCGYHLVDSLAVTSYSEITPICPADSARSTCTSNPNNTIPGAQEYIYRKTLHIPRCQDWVISIDQCCRNNAITNLVGPGNLSMYMSTSLNNASVPVDNSPIFYDIPAVFLMVGQPYNLNFGAFDSDGDSLSYQFTNPYSYGSAITNYQSGLSFANPVISSTPVTLDAVTGIFSCTPSTAQVAVVAINVNEYRQGILIGSIRRDIQLIVTVGSNNLPLTDGVNGSGQFHISVCANNNLTFTVPSHDTDAGDSITLRVLNNIPGATYTVSSTAQPTLTFNWSPDSTMVRGVPYVFSYEVSDNACPFNGRQAYSIAVYVNNCHNSDMWPGDANNDFVCDVYDVLPLGIMHGTTGLTRANPSNNWYAQPSADWIALQPSGTNAKNADSNGDGYIDDNDIAAVNINYGFVHTKTNESNSSIALIAEGNNTRPVEAGDTLIMTINLGDVSNQISAAYGLAFRLQYDPRFVRPDTAIDEFRGGWMIPDTNNALRLIKYLPMHQAVDMAVTRTNHSNIAGYGNVGTVKFIVRDPSRQEVPADTETFDVSTLAPKLLTANGGNVPVASYISPIAWHRTTEGIAGDYLQQNFDLYPNPTKGQLTIALQENVKINRLEVYNLLGEQMDVQSTIQGGKALLDLMQAPVGVYVVNVTTTNGQILHKKFTLVK